MNEEQLEKIERDDEKRDLKQAIADGEAIKGLLGSPAGELLVKQLRDRYELIVLGAVKESEKFRLAAESCQEMAAYLGDTLRIADVAREHLTRLMEGGEEDY